MKNKLWDILAILFGPSKAYRKHKGGTWNYILYVHPNFVPKSKRLPQWFNRPPICSCEIIIDTETYN